jgi:predicted PurR-regulated permease PerM
MVLGIPLALALAAIAGLLTFIPNFGPIIAAVPAMLLALTQSPMQAVYVGALYLGIQTIESYTLEPYVMRKADDLPPALAIASQLFLGVTLGAMGLILATPLLVVVYLLVQRLYVEDVLGDRLAHDTDGEAAGSTSVASLGTPSLGARG